MRLAELEVACVWPSSRLLEVELSKRRAVDGRRGLILKKKRLFTPSHHPLPGVISPRRLRLRTFSRPCADSSRRTCRVRSPLFPRGVFQAKDVESSRR